jgi:hypothetical protein
MALIGLICLSLAGLSLLEPSAPTTDPWGWILWGRELAHLHLSTNVGGAPSWKPLPVLVTTPLALTGAAAPALWLVVARAAGLASLVLAWRLAARLAGRAAGALAPRAAGALAAAGLVVTDRWLRGFEHGYTEPMVIALGLGAVEQELSGRRARAFALGSLAALARPEVWPLLALSGLRLALGRRRGRLLVAAAAVLVPALWVVPDWLGSGQLLHGSRVASEIEAGGPAAALAALGHAAAAAPPVLAAAAALGAWAAFARAREAGARLAGDPFLFVSAGALALAGIVLAMMVLGWPAAPRFFDLSAALITVLGAAGLVLLVTAVEAPARAVAVAVAAAALIVAAAPRAGGAAETVRAAEARARLETSLRAGLRRLDAASVRRCGRLALPIGMAWTKGPVAWELGFPLRSVRSVGDSVDGFVAELASEHPYAAPERPPASPVLVTTRRVSAVLAPFGGAPLEDATHGDRPLAADVLGGRWELAVSRGGPGCRALERRADLAERFAGASRRADGRHR